MKPASELSGTLHEGTAGNFFWDHVLQMPSRKGRTCLHSLAQLMLFFEGDLRCYTSYSIAGGGAWLGNKFPGEVRLLLCCYSAKVQALYSFAALPASGPACGLDWLGGVEQQGQNHRQS